jgi:hypothetical protein
MKAEIKYTIEYIPHPWNEKLRGLGEKAWCLVENTIPEIGPKNSAPIAIFNYSSDAERFQGHVLASGNGLIEIDPDLKEMYERRLKSRA